MGSTPTHNKKSLSVPNLPTLAHAQLKSQQDVLTQRDTYIHNIQAGTTNQSTKHKEKIKNIKIKKTKESGGKDK